MNMATLAIFAYDFISLSRAKIAFERLLNLNMGTSRNRHNKQDPKKPLREKTTGFPGKDISQRACEFLNSIHRAD